MRDPDPAIERWIHQHRNDTDAQLRATVASKVKHCVDYNAALELLDRREKEQRERDLIEADRRHRESIEESRASRRLDKWALTVAVIALLVGGAGLWRSFLPEEPPRLLPAPVSLAPVDHVDPIRGTTPKISVPSTTPSPSPPIPKPDEKPKTSPPTPK